MSGMILLDRILETSKENYPSNLSDDDLFEFYCADNILVNNDLDHSEIESGIVDGPTDAGVDAAYVFINKRLLTEDMKLDEIKSPVEIELYVIQAKNQDSFKEGPVDKLSASLPLLLDPSQPQATLEALFKPKVVAIFKSFLASMQKLAGEFPRVAIRIYYCSKGAEANSVVQAKAASLSTTLRQKYPHVEFTLLGAQQLYDRSSLQKRLVKELPTVGSPLSGLNSYVSLCRLNDYVSFISDVDGALITRMLEANVRAYQGEVEVNREIAKSIAEPTSGVDFWWLNNGVTIVADQAQFMNNRLTIENPLIVNGLQTSHELHNSAEILQSSDNRMVLVRVIVENDRVKRDEVIRATNRQTNISHSSFRATEAIHREIEDYLAALGFYYDRRKNFYKREGKPADKIISIDRLAQALLSVLSQEPHTARARPTTAIKDEKNYKAIFSGDKQKQPLEIYGAAVRMLAAVEGHFRAIADSSNQIHRNNLRFHVLTVVSWAVNGSSTLPALRIPKLDMAKVTPERVDAVTKWVFSEFDAAGAEDRTAKDSSFTNRLKTNWKPELTEPPQPFNC